MDLRSTNAEKLAVKPYGPQPSRDRKGANVSPDFRLFFKGAVRHRADFRRFFNGPLDPEPVLRAFHASQAQARISIADFSIATKAAGSSNVSASGTISAEIGSFPASSPSTCVKMSSPFKARQVTCRP